MKPKKGLAVLAFLITPVFAQEDYVTITPAHPKHGEQITITYDPSARGAVLKDAKDMEVYLGFQFRGEAVEPMKFDNGLWKATMTITDTTSKCCFFYFASSEANDDNGGRHWAFLLHGRDARPLRGAHLARATYGLGYIQDGQFRDSLMMIEYSKELMFYPDNWSARIRVMHLQSKKTTNPDSLKNLIQAEFEKRLAETPDDLSAIQSAAGWYHFFGFESKAVDLENRSMTIAPRCGYVEQLTLNRARNIEDTEKRKGAIEKFLADFPGSVIARTAFDDLFNYYKRKSDHQKMLEIAQRWIETAKGPRANIYNDIAWAFAEMGIYLDTAIAYAHRAVGLVEEERTGWGTFPTDTGYKLKYIFLPKFQRDRSVKYNRGLYRDTEGWAYFQKGMYREAQQLLYEASADAPDDVEIRSRLVKVYEKTGNVDSVYAIHERILRAKPTDLQAREDFKKLYIKKHGSDKGFDELAVEFERRWREAGIEKLASERVNVEGPEWEAKTLDGKSIGSSDFKGKVLVLNFWATWCGPCKAELPHFQKVYEKYKDHPSVAFLALNPSWSRETPEKAQVFLTQNKLSFPAAFDDDARVTERFAVPCIPTTYLIGKNGRIQFKGFGFNPNEDYVAKLSLIIEELLKEK